jgi:PhnB protein
MQVNPYRTFNGNCEEAFKTYQKILGGEIAAMIPHEGTPGEESVPPEWRKKIVHARLVSNGMVLMGSDAPPDRYQPMKGFSVRSLFDHFTTNEAFPLTSPERTPSSALGTSRGVPRREWR